MQQVTTKTIIFNHIPLLNSETDFFRKAVSSAVSKLRMPLLQHHAAPDLFHNHDEITNKNINRYPIIQYQSINSKAAITAINQGATALDTLLGLLLLPQHRDAGQVHIHGRDATLEKYGTLSAGQHTIAVFDELREYRATNWLPFEEERYGLWKDSLSLSERLELLNECLPRQIAAFLGGAGYNEEISYRAFVTNIDKTGRLKEFKVNKLAFDVTFMCNLNLPANIGIGQVPSIGFGRIT